MKQIFYPKNIVVIGVSERPDNLASTIIANLHAFGFTGDLYAVGRKRGEVHGVTIHPSLDEIPDGLDLAVILTPAAIVPDLLETCGRKGIQHVVIESGGFGEFSPEGKQLQDRLLEIARTWDLRIVGPNCISVINLESGVCLPFVPISRQTARPGCASVLSQSGGISINYMDRLSTAGVGVNKVVSMGNKINLDETDYVSYLMTDPGTEMICLYLESLSNGRRLVDLAHSSPKPLIIHKSNRESTSHQIAHSHTAALADDDRIVEAAFHQAGILRAEHFRDTIAIAQGMTLPPVRGNDLMIIARSGGHAVVAADDAARYGFRLPPIPDAFAQQVKDLFRADVITPTNPLDLGVIFDFDLYANIVEECLQALTPDAVLLINAYTGTEAEKTRRLAQRVEGIVKETGRPIAFCAYAMGGQVAQAQIEIGIPIFTEIKDAVRGLAISRQFHQRKREFATVSPHPVGTPPASTSQWLQQPGLLTTDQALSLCQCYDIPAAPWVVARDSKEAAQQANQLGYPVALKLLSQAIVHKSDVGGVVLGLTDATSVQVAAEEMLARAPKTSPAALMVQSMIDGGIEVILGGKQDPSFGPVVMFGLGGIQVEVFDDVAFRVAPISRVDAQEMIAQVRGSRLLAGIRGNLPADQEALTQALLALSRLVTENPQLSEVELNPLLVLNKGVVAVDGRAVVAD